LIVASAYPDPPFDDGGPGDRFRHRADARDLRAARRDLQPVRYSGDDFNGIFDGLAKRYDAVISGTTITPERAAVALFSQAYLEFSQGVAVNRRLTPNVSSVADLRGLTAGIQSGIRPTPSPGASWPRARSPASVLSLSRISAALDDLEAGASARDQASGDLVAGQGPPDLAVAIEVPTHERSASPLPRGTKLCEAVNRALTALRDNGEFARLEGAGFPPIREVVMLHAFKLYTGPDNASHVVEGRSPRTIARTWWRSIARKRRRIPHSIGMMRPNRNT
jgi:ABC-type amino acid transport substrate-binding protein